MNQTQDLNAATGGGSGLTDLLCNIEVGDKLLVRNNADNCADKAGDYEFTVS